jgi:hypothetical protein
MRGMTLDEGAATGCSLKDVNRKCVKEILEQPMMDGSIPCIDELPIATPTS